MTPEQSHAREEIRYTQSVYNSEGDRGRFDGLASAFTEDGVLELDRGTFQGHEAIKGALSGAVEAKRAQHEAGEAQKVFLRHNLTTSRIEFVSDEEANAWTYFFVITPIGPDHCGVYIDNFVKTGERWLIKHRRVKIDWRNPASTVAG